jgi:hypothetical protein
MNKQQFLEDKQQQQIKHNLLRKLVANARAIISNEIGLSVGCLKMSKLMIWLEPYQVSVPAQIFEEYFRATMAIPSGKERLLCSRDALRRYDEQLYPINMKFNDRIIDACFEIIASFADAVDKGKHATDK